MTIKSILTDNAPKPIAPYSQAIRAGDFIFVSGQGPINTNTGNVISGGIRKQVQQTIENIASILKAAGGSLKDVVKTNMYLHDIEDFFTASDAYGEYFSEPLPARTCIQAGNLPGNIGVEIEVIAYIPVENIK